MLQQTKIKKQQCASGFVAIVWARPTYRCHGQVFTYFWSDHVALVKTHNNKNLANINYQQHQAQLWSSVKSLQVLLKSDFQSTYLKDVRVPAMKKSHASGFHKVKERKKQRTVEQLHTISSRLTANYTLKRSETKPSTQ